MVCKVSKNGAIFDGFSQVKILLRTAPRFLKYLSIPRTLPLFVPRGHSLVLARARDLVARKDYSTHF